MITGFIIHFYITFGTNLLTGGPAHIVVLLPVSVFEEALEDPDWINAMHEELHNFERNQVCTLVEKPDNNHNIIGTKWVFRKS